MTKTPQKPTVTTPGRTPSKTVTAGTTSATRADAEPKKKTNLFVFLSEVRQEGRKITWPSFKETWITSVMVLIMVVIATIFFGLVDFGFGYLLQLLTKA